MELNYCTVYNIYQTMIRFDLYTEKEGIHDKHYIQLASKTTTTTTTATKSSILFTNT